MSFERSSHGAFHAEAEVPTDKPLVCQLEGRPEVQAAHGLRRPTVGNVVHLQMELIPQYAESPVGPNKRNINTVNNRSTWGNSHAHRTQIRLLIQGERKLI